MKRYLPILVIATLLIGCSPVEQQAYRTIVAAKAFLDSEKSVHAECVNTSNSTVVCVDLRKATAAKDVLIDAVEVYCASQSFDQDGGKCTPPAKGTSGYEQGTAKIQAAINIYNQAATDLKGVVK